jgi:hypothetical protein
MTTLRRAFGHEETFEEQLPEALQLVGDGAALNAASYCIEEGIWHSLRPLQLGLWELRTRRAVPLTEEGTREP